MSTVDRLVRSPGSDGCGATPDAEPTEESESAVYAVVRAGSKQQKVAVGDVIEIDQVSTGVGETLTLPV